MVVAPKLVFDRDLNQSRSRLARMLYDSVYCARGQAENLINLHKTQLASDRTSAIAKPPLIG